MTFNVEKIKKQLRILLSILTIFLYLWITFFHRLHMMTPGVCDKFNFCFLLKILSKTLI